MLGWEFPPKISGGLGVASKGLAEAIAQKNVEIDFFLPKKDKTQVSKEVNLIDASTIVPDLDYWRKSVEKSEVLLEVEIGSRLIPYLPAEIFKTANRKKKTVTQLEDTTESRLLESVKLSGGYGDNLWKELAKYGLLAVQHAKGKKYDLIHAHDWVTFKAGRMVAESTGLPLVVHVHSTEHDRNGFAAHSQIVEEEAKGLKAAKRIFCVSHTLKQTVYEKYRIEKEKIDVVPNSTVVASPESRTTNKEKRVAFIGRLTHQKNPFAFVDIARDLVSRGVNAQFWMIGDGHLRHELESKVQQVNLGSRFRFTGFLDQTKVLKQLNEIDLLIAPSTSEPFGLVILEAVMKRVPVICAAGVGVADFIPSLPQVEHWNQFGYAKLAEQLLSDKKVCSELIEKCFEEGSKLSWDTSADLVIKAYKRV